MSRGNTGHSDGKPLILSLWKLGFYRFRCLWLLCLLSLFFWSRVTFPSVAIDKITHDVNGIRLRWGSHKWGGLDITKEEVHKKFPHLLLLKYNPLGFTADSKHWGGKEPSNRIKSGLATTNNLQSLSFLISIWWYISSSMGYYIARTASDSGTSREQINSEHKDSRITGSYVVTYNHKRFYRHPHSSLKEEVENSLISVYVTNDGAQ